ncbi:MAG: hypothetical protein IT210_23835 [Armatimonadetes bacterium]|nr:hypothetical protein [Armatimonadota bacterium]
MIVIEVPHPMITSKSVAWGGTGPELFIACQEAIRCAVQCSQFRSQLQEWLEKRIKLKLIVNFHLGSRRVSHSGIDSLLSDLLNALVEGACGPRPAGKPIPQTKDALFWQILATKIQDNEEKIVLEIGPLTQVAT